MPHFINNQAGRPNEGSEERTFTASTSGICHSVTQFGHLNEVCFHAVLATSAAKGLRQMSFAGSRFPNEGEVFVGVEGGQRREVTQLVNVLPSDAAEIEVVKGFRNLQRQSARPQQEVNGGAVFLCF